MGDKANSKRAHGTKGQPQQTIFQEDYDKEVEDLQEKILLEELFKRNPKVKINVDELKFITIDRNGNITWLEKGNNLSGYQHLLKHKDDFQKAYGYITYDLINFLKKTITYGTLVEETREERRGKIGLRRVYKNNDSHIVVFAVGTNGYIVSARPEPNYQKKEKMK